MQLRCNLNIRQVCSGFGLFFLLLAVFSLSSLPMAKASAAEAGASAKGPAQPIHISADRLVTDNNAGTAEFIGRVHATQGNTVIDSNRMKIFYSSAAADDSEENTGGSVLSSGKRSVTRITAIGRVRIRIDDNKAEADKADYKVAKRVLVLTGPKARIISGNNTISGPRITFYRDSGRIDVDGSGRNRIEAVFNPGSGGLQ